MLSAKVIVDRDTNRSKGFGFVEMSTADEAQIAVDSSTSKFKFKGIIPGVRKYQQQVGAIDWLEAAGLVIKIPIVNSAELPLMAYTKENTFKLMMLDVGILGAMSGLPPKAIISYDYGTYKGYFAENFVAQEFLCQEIHSLCCWQEKRAEVEFLREAEGEVIPIEVKSGSVTRAKSLKSFVDKYTPPYSVIMSGKNLYIDREKNSHFYPLYLAGRFPLI